MINVRMLRERDYIYNCEEEGYYQITTVITNRIYHFQENTLLHYVPEDFTLYLINEDGRREALQKWFYDTKPVEVKPRSYLDKFKNFTKTGKWE